MSWQALRTEIEKAPSNRDATQALIAAGSAEERIAHSLGLDRDELIEIGEQALSALGGGHETDSRALRVLAEAIAGIGYESNDEYEPGCLEYALELAQRSGDSIESLALKAELLMRNKRFKEGSAALEGLPLDHWRVCYATAKLTHQTRNPVMERKALRAAVNHAPEPRKAMLANRMASVLYDFGRYDEAIAAEDEAIRLRPDFAWAHYNRAAFLFMCGRPEEALPGVQRALQIGRFGAAINLLQKLQAGGPAKPLKKQELARLCDGCGSAAPPSGPCPRCQATTTLELTAAEIRFFRKVKCARCGAEQLGFARHCPGCGPMVGAPKAASAVQPGGLSVPPAAPASSAPAKKKGLHPLAYLGIGFGALVMLCFVTSLIAVLAH